MNVFEKNTLITTILLLLMIGIGIVLVLFFIYSINT